MTSKGKKNPNYRHGRQCGDSLCSCGRVKDYRSKRCSVCAGIGFPKGDKGKAKRTVEEVKEAVSCSRTILEAAPKMGVIRNTAKALIRDYDLSIDHFDRTRFREYTPETAFVKGKGIQQGTLKRLLFSEGVKEECVKCGQGPEWGGEPLTLQLHHRDGDRLNNLRENLNILCPNCHTQTNTYTGRNSRGIKKRNKCGQGD